MSDRPRLLDLFCGGGGASMGYWLAGFDVVGVDIDSKSRYPFPFFQADALEFVWLYASSFDAVHASPPCQAYSSLAKRWPERKYPELIEPTREALIEAGVLYVIENVPEAPLINPVTFCGSAFEGLQSVSGLKLRRHRAFEANWPLVGGRCEHDPDLPTISVTGHAGRAGRNNTGTTLERRQAMEIPWLTSDALCEAIPPAYTQNIGWQLIDYLRNGPEEMVDVYVKRLRGELRR